MAFNKVFIILALAACALAMPVHQVDQTTPFAKVESTSGSIDVKVEDATAVHQEAITTVATGEAATGKDEETATESTSKTEINEEIVDQAVAKRSVEEESSADNEDMETAAGTNVLRPLFVYRQQVAYRQRVKNANRRGNRRF